MKKIINHLKENWIRHGFETLVVTVGILGAFTLNNWNENSKEEEYRKQLLIDLRTELHEARTAITPKINLGERLTSESLKLLKIIRKKNHDISVDSLKSLTRSILTGVLFELTLSAYDEAKSSGRLSIVGHNKLAEGYSKIYAAMAKYRLHTNISADVYFKGSTYELRKFVGDPNVLTEAAEEVSEDFQLTDSEYLELTVTPIFFSAVQNANSVHRNVFSNLIEVDMAMSRVDSILHQVQEE